MRQQVIIQAERSRLYWRAALTGGIGILFLGLLAGRLQTVEPARVLAAMGSIGFLHLAWACLGTIVSFWAVAGYDQAWHRHLQTGLSHRRVRRAGFAAIAIGQTVGLGIVSGALVRWRMLPELGLLAATRLTALVALSFLLAWAVLTMAMLATLPGAPFAGLAPWGLALVGVLGVGALASGSLRMPNLFTSTRLMALAAVDCLGAGLALWVLIPGDLALTAFLPAFLLALGAGLVSGSPAGLGAFEIVFLSLIPMEPGAGLLAAVVTWRAVYFAGPALIGVGVALWVRAEADRGAVRRLRPPEIAEAGLAAQGDLAVHPAGCVAGRTTHGLVALSAVADLGRFRAAAREEGRWPVLYKLSGRAAVAARRAGMRVLPVAREAWLDPQSFRLDVPSRSGLRRKVRRAEAAGLTAALCHHPDWTALARVNAAWIAVRGREHGFAMGRFDPAYLARQAVFVARRDGKLAGFASFHVARVAGREVWTLDLMRPDPDGPDGTAQLLVLAALAAAGQTGVAALSLAAVPIGAVDADRSPVARLGRGLARDALRGLDQFKSGFAPRWQRLYIAAPSGLALGIVGGEILHRVCRPVPLAQLQPTQGPPLDYEIATGRNPWQREEDKLA